MDDLERLAAIPWFAGLGSELRTQLFATGRWQRRAAGEWLYGEGDEDTGLVAVVEGALHLYAQAPGGREVLFTVMPRGGVLGQSVVFGGGPRLVTAICALDCLVFLLSDRALRQAGANQPALWQSLSALVYAQLRTVIQSQAEFIALRPRQRMIARLLALSAPGGPIPISQAALAEIVGVSRNAVNGWLAELEQAGLIARGYGRIEVRNPAGLRMRLAR